MRKHALPAHYLEINNPTHIPLIAPSTFAHSMHVSQEHASVKNIAKSWQASVRKTNTHPTVQDIQKYLRSPTQTVPGHRQAHGHGHQRGSSPLFSEAEGGWGGSRKPMSLSKME